MTKTNELEKLKLKIQIFNSEASRLTSQLNFYLTLLFQIAALYIAGTAFNYTFIEEGSHLTIMLISTLALVMVWVTLNSRMNKVQKDRDKALRVIKATYNEFCRLSDSKT